MNIKTIGCFVIAFGPTLALADVVDFEAFSPAPFINNTSFSSGGVNFSNYYDAEYGSWFGFALSSATDTTTPGYGNQYSSITGGGAGGSPNYAVVCDGGSWGTPIVTLPAGKTFQSVKVTNTTYAYLAILNGDDGWGGVRQFGDLDKDDDLSGNQGEPDSFTLTFTGYAGPNGTGDITGTTTFALADYTFADNEADYVVNEWTEVALSSLGAARSMTLALSSTDNGEYGINTPAYVALDDLQLVPEPASIASVFGAALLMLGRRRRNG